MKTSIANYQAALNTRIDEMVSACTRCGACVEVCPMPARSPVDASEPVGLIGDVTAALMRGAQGEPTDASDNASSWASVCSGTGSCISACPESLNPRFMLAALREMVKRERPLQTRRNAGRDQFKKMARGVRVLSRLQMPKPVMERLSPSSHPQRLAPADVVFYTGCNLLKTPHIGLTCLDVLDRLGRTYEVHGGSSSCCGIYQARAGDTDNSLRQSMRTLDQLAAANAPTTLSWCPTCQMQFSETMVPIRLAGGENTTSLASMQMFPVYLAEHLAELTPHFRHAVPRRVALYEHPGSPGVTEAVIALLQAIPELEVVTLPVERFGYAMGSLGALPEERKAYLARILRAAAAADVDTLAGVYHSDHREIVAHEPYWPYEIVNFMELIGASMGISHEDTFKRLKLMQDTDAIVAECADLIDAHSMDLDEVREVVLADMLQDQFLNPNPALHPDGTTAS